MKYKIIFDVENPYYKETIIQRAKVEDFIEKYISNLAEATTDEERASWQKSLDFQLNQYCHDYGEDYMDVRENRIQAENDKLRISQRVKNWNIKVSFTHLF